MVRAKFRCIQKQEKESGGFIIRLIPFSDGSEENKRFFELTPAGSVHLETINPEAAKQFKEGAEYYIDFTKCELSAQAESDEEPPPEPLPPPPKGD